ncbi:hypothetical protein [Archangium lansingense]|uniref:Uncharacterized protein n=1 Tax=Archangium lansingense TaxID=2995310 RepID=A0ABT4AP42_9BACT|nr:hypothetical protein [Archangium lansinium]MCY1083478.1 hypothetical protein [Archangium lansinium]
MNPREPVRLLEEGSEASAELRALLGAASLDEPSPEQLAALAGKLGPLLEAPEAPASSAASEPSSDVAPITGGGLKTKVLAGLAVAAIAGGSFQAGRVFERERAVERPVETVVVAPVPVEAPAPAPARVEAAPAPAPAVAAETPAPETKAVPAPRVPRARAPDAPATAPAMEARETMDEELALLESAYQAVRRGDAGGALAEAERHATRFPEGALAQEREVLAIDALVRLGRRTEAEARAERFRAHYPTSTHGVRIQGLLSGTRP